MKKLAESKDSVNCSSGMIWESLGDFSQTLLSILTCLLNNILYLLRYSLKAMTIIAKTARIANPIMFLKKRRRKIYTPYMMTQLHKTTIPSFFIIRQFVNCCLAYILSFAKLVKVFQKKPVFMMNSYLFLYFCIIILFCRQKQ